MFAARSQIIGTKLGFLKGPSNSPKRTRFSSAARELCNFQAFQYIHDEKYHQDIWCLPFNARIKHMVLHFAKYTGKVLAAKEDKDKVLLRKTIIDTWIITLACANILNVKLSRSLGLDEQDASNLQKFGATLLSSHFSDIEDPYLLTLRHLGKTTGQMAKACESMDHGEAFDSRGTLERGVIELARLCLALATLLHLDLIPLVQDRWKEVEAKSIF